MDVFGVAADLWQAYATDNMFLLARQMRADEIWFILAIPFLIFVALTVLLLRAVPFLDRNFEKWIMIALYLGMTAIIFVEVPRRFFFNVQAPWSSTVPAWLFLVLTWLGAAYSIKRRTQLNFNELRSIMPRGGQIAMLGLDWFLWTAFAFIIFVVGVQRSIGSAANFQIVPGTDGIMQWWFYATIPAAWVLLAARAWMVFSDDRENYRTGRPLVEQASITETE